MALQRPRRPGIRSGRLRRSRNLRLQPRVRPVGCLSPLRRQPVTALGLVWGAVSLIFVLQPLAADQPLPPPSKYQVCSPDQAFCAEADPDSQTTSIFARGSATPIWSLGAWHRQVFFANGGDYLVIGPDGTSLISLGTKLSDPLLTFMKRNSVVRVVKVGDLFPSLSALERTASHYFWGNVLGVSPRNQLLVHLVGGRRVAFSVLTGRIEAEK